MPDARADRKIETPDVPGAAKLAVGSAIVDIVGSHGDAAGPFVQEFVASLSGALTTSIRETAA